MVRHRYLEPSIIALLLKLIRFFIYLRHRCGHCKRMAPTWDELAVKFVGRPNIKIAKVDCTLGENKDLCAEQEVDGFPTVYLYRNGEKIEEYNGSRQLDDLFEYVSKHAEGHDEL